MESYLLYFLVFGLPVIVIWTTYLTLYRRTTRKALNKLDEAERSGMTEPVSLHPSIDPNKCLGCGTCISACPEGDILGMVKRRAVLVSPTSCIGHGACRASCPTQAITLVFGSETRGVEIPLLSPDFQTSEPGIYIAGELGGMGLIKNAITQAQQAIDSIARVKAKGPALDYDVIIVGAGPAGLSSSLAAKAKKLRYLALEQDTVGGAIAHYPRGKIIMTQPAELPLVGNFQFREASKESLVEFWDNVIKETKLNIKTGQRVDDIQRIDGGFVVKTPKSEFKTRTVLLTMGRRGTPRKLGVPGEELPKVVYRLKDPEQFQGKNVLVVGGGDSAIEAAISLSEQTGTQAILSYRSAAFSRAKPKNRERVELAQQKGQLRIMLETNVKQITKTSVTLETNQGLQEFPNDDVIVCAGGLLPTPFLRKVGIHVEEKFGTA